MTEAVAAIDCGSNSTRLLIATSEGPLRREMRITRLSEGVDASGTLSAPAQARTYETLGSYREMMDDAGVDRALLVATSAVRDAANGADFLAEAARRTGARARLLRGEEEAALSYAGALGDLPPSATPTMIVDVGGGSTELAVELDGTLFSYSMQLGCVRVCERALGRGIVGAGSDHAARAMIHAELDRAWAAVPELGSVFGAVRLVGLAGTVATLAQLDAQLTRYDRAAVHHRVLTRNTVVAWRDTLAREGPEDRLRRPGMVPGREDVLAAGLYILDAVMGRLGVAELLSSENDILDGVAALLLSG